MPVKGTLSVVAPEQRLGNMIVGEEAYIDAYSLNVTEKAIFIDLVTFITYKKDFVSDAFDYYVAIRRIGEGLSQDDFELDVSALDDFEFSLEGSDTFLNLMESKDDHLVFTDFSFKKVTKLSGENMEGEETVESLTEEMNSALEEQDYRKADQLQKRIDALQEKKS